MNNAPEKQHHRPHYFRPPQVYEKQKQKRELLKQNAYLAEHDQLTGLYNRHFLEKRAKPLVDSIITQGKSVSAILIDIDKFKIWNDTFSHKAGDTILKRVSGEIASSLDIGDMTIRYGGEEILILLEKDGLTSQKIAERVRHYIETVEQIREPRIIINGEEKSLTISLGVAESKNLSLKSTEELINAADLAMYDSKTNGRNQTTLMTTTRYQELLHKNPKT